MRRITLTLVTTLAILVLLFGYRTSRDQSVTASTVAVGSAHVVSAGSAVAGTSAAGPDPLPAPSVDRRANPSTPASSSTSPTRRRTTAAPATAIPTTTPSTSHPRVSTTPSVASRTSTPSATTTPTSISPPITAATTTTTTKVDGAAVSTRYGDVQVEVTISNGRITDVQTLQYPNQELRDQQINGDALPQLQAQVLSAQSANIAGVSGATFTTQGYIGSVQSALDAAKFK